MAQPKTTTSVGITSWWLDDGDQECPHCGHLYYYEVEFRCTDCDGPGCPHCRVVHEAGHVICPGCIEPKKGRRPREASKNG